MVIYFAPSTPRIIKSRGNTVAHNLCCFHPEHAEAACIAWGARARIMSHSISVRALCAHNLAHNMAGHGPIQRFKSLAVSIFCVSFLPCLILQSPSFFTLHGSEQVKISVRALCAHNLAHNMAGHGPHSATVKLSKGAHVQPMAPWKPLLIRNMEINAQSIMRGLLAVSYTHLTLPTKA